LLAIKKSKVFFSFKFLLLLSICGLCNYFLVVICIVDFDHAHHRQRILPSNPASTVPFPNLQSKASIEEILNRAYQEHHGNPQSFVGAFGPPPPSEKSQELIPNRPYIQLIVPARIRKGGSNDGGGAAPGPGQPRFPRKPRLLLLVLLAALFSQCRQRRAPRKRQPGALSGIYREPRNPVGRRVGGGGRRGAVVVLGAAV